MIPSDAGLIQWNAWSLGQDRCPYCIGMCPAEWSAICDCFMAPESDEWCDKCKAEHDQFAALYGDDVW